MARKQTRMQLKRDIEANWKKATNFTPLLGEVVIYEPDETHIIPRLKIGDGETNVNDLPFLSSASVSTIGKGSFGSGISSGIAGESFNVPILGNITIDDMSNFKVATATSAGASSIQFKIGGLAASTYYKYLETLLNNGYSGGLLVIKEMVLPALTYTLSTTGSLIKSYYITIQLMDGYTTTVDLTTSDYPTNLYAGVAYGEASQAFGTATFAFADNSHTEGNLTRTLGDASHAEGYLTSAESVAAHAEGSSAVASGSASHAEGGRTKAIGDYSHAEGGTSEASGMYSHAEGSNTRATNTSAHAEGSSTYATAANSHAEGMGTHAEGEYSHAEGANSYATKSFSHAEGHASQATGSSSHAEGNHTIASGDGSHAEGNSSIASGTGAHAGGGSSIASGVISFAHGSAPQALGTFSTAFGNQTVAVSANAFVVGKFNEAVKQITDDSGNITQAASDKGAMFVVGNGSGEDGTVDGNGNPYSRSDAFRVFYNGTAELPTATVAEINGRGNKAVPTVEWVKNNTKTVNGESIIGTGDIKTISNWDQCDSAQPDYIANRTHGVIKMGKAFTAFISNYDSSGSMYKVSDETLEMKDLQNCIITTTTDNNKERTYTSEDYIITEENQIIQGLKITSKDDNDLVLIITSIDYSLVPEEMPEEDIPTPGIYLCSYTTNDVITGGGGIQATTYYTTKFQLVSEIKKLDKKYLPDIKTINGEDIIGDGNIITVGQFNQNYGEIFNDYTGRNVASGMYSHAEGWGTAALGDYSHASGFCTEANYENQTVIGKHNNNKTDTLFEIGNGDDGNSKNNAFEVYKDGTIKVKGTISSIDSAPLYLSCLNNSDISISDFGISLSTNGNPITIQTNGAAATYNDSEIATMDNLIQSGTVLPDASSSDAPKFFVLI